MALPKQKPPKGQEWARVRAAFEECQSLPPADQQIFVQQLGEESPWLQSEVESLLRSLQSGEERFENPITPILIPLSTSTTEAGSASVVPEQLRVGRYRLLRLIGRGGMAEVHLARTEGAAGFERLLALKRTLPEYKKNPSVRKLFEYEARLSGVLHHVNIVQVYDFREIDGEYLLTMEYVEGKDLASLAKKQLTTDELPVQCLIYVIIEVCKALDYAHQRRDPATGKPLGIIHRDISPRNILISYEGDVKLVDFGIAKSEGRPGLTETGQIRGTLAYLSPEVALGQPPDSRCDLFSLSAVLFELVTCDDLFHSENLFDLIRQIQICERPQRKLEAQADLAPELKAILTKGLEKDPSLRYQTAHELQQELETFLGDFWMRSSKKVLSQQLRKLFAEEIEKEKKQLAAALAAAAVGSAEPIAIETGNLPSPDAPQTGTDVSTIGVRPSVEISASPPVLEGGGVSPVWRWSIIALLAVLVLLAIWGAAHRWLVTPAPSASVVTSPPDCKLEVVTEPTGARIFRNGAELGSSPLTITNQCGKIVTLSIQKTGYHNLNEQVRLDPSLAKISRALNKVPDVYIDLELNRSATIYVDERYVADAKEGHRFKIRLEPKDRYQFRFVNKRLGIDTRREVTVPLGSSPSLSIDLN